MLGNPKVIINGISPIENTSKGTITFIYDKKYFKYIPSIKASAVVISDEALIANQNGILVDNPRLAIANILEYFSPNYKSYKEIHKSTIIDETAKIGDKVTIGPNTVIESNVIIEDNVSIGPNNTISHEVFIGKNSKIDSNIHLYPRTRIGSNCIILSGVIIGSDGYGFVTEDDVHFKIPQNGKVIIGNNVEIGANSTIDRGTIGDTTIGDMCKLDNGVQIGHNVSIGKGCLLTAHVTIAGSAKIGSFCVFGGQAGAIDHVTIGDRAVFACYTAVTKDLPGGKMYSGSPAREIKEKNKRDAVFLDVRRLKNRLDKLEKNFNN